MSLHVGAPFEIYRNPAHYCGPGPAVVIDDDGRLTVAFRRVPSWLPFGMSSHWHPATESCLTHSVDEGISWSAPEVFLGGYQCPNLRRLRDGSLIHHTHRFELVTEALYDAADTGAGGGHEANWPGLQDGTPVWRSTDGGHTWGEPVYLSGVPGLAPLHPRLHMPVAVRGNLLETRSGRLLVSAYTIRHGNTSHVFASDDGGRSWSWLAAIGDDLNETYLHETDAGDLVAFLRRHSDADVLCACRSRDGGVTWGAPEPLCRGYPACAARLPSGRVLLAYGYRFDEGYGVRARLLTADAELDPAAAEVVLCDDGAGLDDGYPDVACMPDGRAVVVYYHNSSARVPEGGEPAQAPRYIEGCFVEER